MPNDVDCLKTVDAASIAVVDVRSMRDGWDLAGELAAQWQILPWPPGVAFNAAARCFRDWLGNRGHMGAQETEVGIRQVRSFLQKYGDSRFATLSADGSDQSPLLHDRAGYREVENGTTYFLVFPQVFEKDICRGFDAKLIARPFRGLGHLRCAPCRLQYQKRLPSAPNPQWVYAVKSTLLEIDDNVGH